MKNVITWFAVPTVDFDRAVKFYSDILEAKVTVREYMGQKLGFFPMDEGVAMLEGVGGNLVPPSDDFKPSRDGTIVYFSCEGRLDKALSLVEQCGGKIVKPKSNIGEPGWIAVIEDTEGNNIGLHSLK